MRLSLTRSGKVEFIILALFTVWFLLTVIVPFTLPTNSVRDLSGVVGTIDNEDALAAMNPVAKAVYTVGDAYCHQISGRSYYLNGNQMPFCARDEGIFLGLMLGMVVAVVTRYEISGLVLVLGVLPIAVDGLLQLITSYESTNPLRVITGLLAGIVVALLISLFAREAIRDEKPADSQDGNSAVKSR
jgi:uncharacterized membrane protein